MMSKSIMLQILALLATPAFAFMASGPRTVVHYSSLFLQQKRKTTIICCNCSEDIGGTISSNDLLSRRNAFNVAISSSIFLGIGGKEANAIPEQKSYSSNARNLDRLSAGDSSGGSVYNNSPTSAAAARRRAMVGCKIDASRRAAMVTEGMQNFSEKDCNLKVMDGDTEFMLKTLRELDCPSCPYGIKGA
jgi:hypothetical protein